MAHAEWSQHLKVGVHQELFQTEKLGGHRGSQGL
jgi:hypothetical protein